MSLSDTIRSEILGEKQHITFHGRLDTATSQQIQNDVMQLVEGTQHPFVFDLGQVDFVASAFLRLCILTARKVGPDRFSLVNVTPGVGRVFSIAGLDKHLKMIS